MINLNNLRLLVFYDKGKIKLLEKLFILLLCFVV